MAAIPSRLASTRIETAAEALGVGQLDGHVEDLVEREPLPRPSSGCRLLDRHDVPPEEREHGIRFGGHGAILTTPYGVRNKCYSSAVQLRTSYEIGAE